MPKIKIGRHRGKFVANITYGDGSRSRNLLGAASPKEAKERISEFARMLSLVSLSKEDQRRFIDDYFSIKKSDRAVAMERNDTRLVYFIASESGVIKIGMSAHPERRLQDLQYKRNDKLTLLGACAGGRKKEQALHREFAEHRVKGEWFDAGERLWATIEDLTGYQRRPLCVQSGEYVPRWFGR